MSKQKYTLSFYENWITERSQMSLIPYLEGLIGTKVRFRDNAADRKKNYLFHSPASVVARRRYPAAFSGLPIALSLLCGEEIKKYDRFLTFKVVMHDKGEAITCAYITLKIKPCEVEPLKTGGITEGREIVGYDIILQDGLEDTTAHSFMSIDLKGYAEWLEKEIKKEYLNTVETVMEDKEISEPFSIIRYLTDTAEDTLQRAKRLTCRSL